MWSGISLDFASNVTQYAPYGGGGKTSTTETAVSTKASGAVTISNLHVNIDVAIGASATLAITLENGTATPSTLTCTTVGGGTTCDDTTHSVSVTNLNLLSWKLVSSGSVTSGLPNIKVSYAVGGALSASISANAPLQGIGTSGDPLRCDVCALAISPGAGIARSAGSTQTLTTSELSGAVSTSASNVTTLLAAYRTRGIEFNIGDPAAINAISAGNTATAYFTSPVNCTITAYDLTLQPSGGTVTVKFWKVASGTAAPTSANSINTSGVGISTGTSVHSTVLSDFTSTAVTAYDRIAMNVTAASTTNYVNGVLTCVQP